MLSDSLSSLLRVILDVLMERCNVEVKKRET